MKKRKLWGIMLILLAGAFLFTGCSAKENNEPEERPMKLAYICKDLGHYWFRQEETGIKSKCETLGISVSSFDVKFSDKECMRVVNQVIDENYDGIIICAPNEELGPEIAKLCEEAKIPVVAIDDGLSNENGEALPVVSMALNEVCEIGGSELIRMANAMEFPLKEETTHVMMINVSSTDTFRTRNDAFKDALMAGGVRNADYVTLLSTTGMYEDNMESAKSYFQEHPPEPSDYWILCGANDDCGLALLHTLRQMGIPDEHMVACGVGGYELSIEEFTKGKKNYITVMTKPDQEGEKAVEMLYANLTEGVPMASEVMIGGVVATCDNFMIYFDGSAG